MAKWNVYAFRCPIEYIAANANMYDATFDLWRRLLLPFSWTIEPVVCVCVWCWAASMCTTFKYRDAVNFLFSRFNCVSLGLVWIRGCRRFLLIYFPLFSILLRLCSHHLFYTCRIFFSSANPSSGLLNIPAARLPCPCGQHLIPIARPEDYLRIDKIVIWSNLFQWAKAVDCGCVCVCVKNDSGLFVDIRSWSNSPGSRNWSQHFS